MSQRKYLFLRCIAYIIRIHKHNNIELVYIQAIKNKEDINGCTAANCHRCNYQAHIYHHHRRSKTPVVSPLFDVEEIPSHKTLTSRNNHKPRKTGSSPIRPEEPSEPLQHRTWGQRHLALQVGGSSTIFRKQATATLLEQPIPIAMTRR
jgi:hypothetical protein